MKLIAKLYTIFEPRKTHAEKLQLIRGPILAILLVIAMGGVAIGPVGPANAALNGVTTDAWDVSNGVVITNKSPCNTFACINFPISNMFGTTINDTAGLFNDFHQPGTLHFVEWQTPAPVTIASFNLSAYHDNHVYAPAGQCDLPTFFRDAQHRGFNRFTLKAFNTTTAAFDIVLYDATITLGDDNTVHPGENALLYDPTAALGPDKNRLDITHDVPLVTAIPGCPANPLKLGA